jgi:hypothetical protein
MNQNKFGFSFACIAAMALLVATPAMGQLVNFPVLALAPGDADGNTSIGAGWGRGLNDQSGKLNLFGAGIQRSMEMVSFGINGGYLRSGVTGVDNEVALAGSVAYHLPVDGPASVSIQSGIGWFNPFESVLIFPFGVAISGSSEAGSATVSPWVMPRVQFTRVGGTASSTETDFGASGGVSVQTEGGFGFGVALDWLLQQDQLVPADNASSLGVGVYVFYALP